MALIPKYFAFIKTAIPIVIGVNDDSITVLALEIRVGVILDHPEPPSIVEIESDRLHHVRLSSEERDMESFGHGYFAKRFLGGDWMVLGILRVDDSGRESRFQVRCGYC